MITVIDLFREGKIDQFQYDTYVLFEAYDLGRAYLKNMLNMIVMEDALESKFEWHDGRRFSWREIKRAVNEVNMILQEAEHDRVKY